MEKEREDVMKVHLQREIDRLKQKILLMAGDVETAMQKAIRSLREGDRSLAQSVIDNDRRIDVYEVEIEEECLKILALHQPVAIDLRFVVAVLKINNDLERIADMAVNTAERVIDLTQASRLPIPDQLTIMVEVTQSMLKRSLDALVNMDTELARAVITDDDILDDLHSQMYALVEVGINADPAQTACQINLLSISRQLERTGDLVTNIAEDVIYMVEGEIVRHRL